MTPTQFVAKWRASTLKERAGSQEHFLDLCHLLGVPTPAEADPSGEWFCFEKGAKKTSGRGGFADVWRRGCFGWEYKGKHKSLVDAFKQLQGYTPALEYPPLLIVSDMERIIIHTAFTGTVPEVHELSLDDLLDSAKRQLLHWAFTDPERLRPGRTTAKLTETAAARFGTLAQALRSRGHDPLQVAHFSQQLLFCLFTEDIELLPNRLFSRLLDAGLNNPDQLPTMLSSLFQAMAHGGLIGLESIDWFNGGLFQQAVIIPLQRDDLKLLRELAEMDWSAIEPSIFGTLFERGLDPDQRAQLGAHYTDPASIMRLVNPVVLEPLREHWTTLAGDIATTLDKAAAAKTAKTQNKHLQTAQRQLQTFLEQLRQFRVLDPACGSGNFLLLALLGLKDLEHQILIEAEELGLPRSFPSVGPENVLGIELNPYAAELARVTVWIGEIQWMLNHGFSLNKQPILKPLDHIAQRDAILDEQGQEPEWPAADVIVGNPPFLGGSKKRALLGDAYFADLERIYSGRVPAGADLVTYWFEKARSQIAQGKAQAAGLVATNSIRGGANRKVLARICESGKIFNAWSDEPWINAGAAVRVSFVCFGKSEAPAVLNGEAVNGIYADLTAANFEMEVDLTTAKPLKENAMSAFQGTKKYGKFDVCGELARQWLTVPNPHGRSNSEVVKPWKNGQDLTKRASDTWIIDFGESMSKADAELFEAPFEYVFENVFPERQKARVQKTKTNWWIHERPRPKLCQAIAKLKRYIATPMVAKYRLFVWLDKRIFPDQQLIVIVRADDTTFGILHSRFHELWALRMGTSLGATPRYTPTTTFETFPFPNGLTPADTKHGTATLASGAIVPQVAEDRRTVAAEIAEAAQRLNQLRENWLNPPEWVERVPEVVPGYPERIIPKPEHEKQLKQRTLTNLYNQRPAWLDHAHRALDTAVAAAYGWDDDSPEMPDAEILSRLLALNGGRTHES